MFLTHCRVLKHPYFIWPRIDNNRAQFFLFHFAVFWFFNLNLELIDRFISIYGHQSFVLALTNVLAEQ